MRLLVVAPQAVRADDIRSALPDDDVGDAEVMVVAPALHESGLRFWMSDADEEIAQAERAQEQTVGELRSEGVSAHGDTGEADPLQAVQDALATFSADRVLLFVRPEEEARYRERDVLDDAERRLGVPVTAATLAAR